MPPGFSCYNAVLEDNDRPTNNAVLEDNDRPTNNAV